MIVNQNLFQTNCQSQKTEHSNAIPSSCACRSLQKGKMSLEKFEYLVSYYRGIDILSPSSPEKWKKLSKISGQFAKHLVDDFFGDILSDYYTNMPKHIKKIINNNGSFERDGDCYKLILLNKNEKLVGAMMLRTEIASVDICALRVSESHAKQYIATIMLACAVKIAQENNRSTINLCSTDEGVIPYLRFGFVHYRTSPSDWKKLPQKRREKLAFKESELLLHIDLQQTKVAMNEQLYRALIDNPYSLVSNELNEKD